MSKVIDSFLVALGFEVDERSNKEANAAISGLKTNAIQLGVAISGALLSGGYIAKSTAAEIDKISNAAKLLSSVNAGQLDQLRNAYSLIGGSADQANSDLDNLESKLDALRRGDEGLYNQLGVFDIPVEFLQDAKDGLDMLRKIAEIMPTLSEKQRNYLGKTMGLSEGGRLLTQEGPGQFQDYMSRSAELTQVDPQMSESARELTKSFTELGLAIKDIFRDFTKGAAPGITETVGDWVEALKGMKGGIGAGILFGESAKILSPDKGRPLGYILHEINKWNTTGTRYAPQNYQPTMDQIAPPQSVLAGEGKVIRTINDHRRFDIHVHGSTDADAVADKVLRKVSESSATVTEETRTGVAG